MHTCPSSTFEPNSTSIVTTFPGMDEEIIPLFLPLLTVLFLGALLTCPSGSLILYDFPSTVTT